MPSSKQNSKYTKQNAIYVDGDQRQGYESERLSEAQSSDIFPWMAKMTSRRNVPVPSHESGRQVQSSGFFLCFLACLLLCTGIMVTGASIWGMLYRLPYTYLFNKSIIFNSSNFGLIGGILGIPCSWIVWTAHENKRNYLLFPLLLLLLTFSLSMLSTGMVFGIIYRTQMNFANDSYPPKLIDNEYKRKLNESLKTAMIVYDTTFNNIYSWDKIQRRLKCCGIESSDDWEIYFEYTPKSCYDKEQGTYKQGCLDWVAYDIAWQLCMLTGFSSITFAVQAATMIFAGYLYFREKLTITERRPLQVFM